MESADGVCWGLRQVLQRWRLTEAVITDAVVVASELIINAVEHARTDWALVVELRGRELYVAVEDDLVGSCPTGFDYAAWLRSVAAR